MKKLLITLLSITTILAILKIWLPISWSVVTMPIWLPMFIGAMWCAASIKWSDTKYHTPTDTSDWGEKMESARRNAKR